MSLQLLKVPSGATPAGFYTCSLDHETRQFTAKKPYEEAPFINITFQRYIKIENDWFDDDGKHIVEKSYIFHEKGSQYVYVHEEAFRFWVLEDDDEITDCYWHRTRNGLKSVDIAVGRHHFYLLGKEGMLSVPKRVLEMIPASMTDVVEQQNVLLLYYKACDFISGITWAATQGALKTNEEYYDMRLESYRLDWSLMVDREDPMYLLFERIKALYIPLVATTLSGNVKDYTHERSLRQQRSAILDLLDLLDINATREQFVHAFVEPGRRDISSNELACLLAHAKREEIVDWIADTVGDDKLMESVSELLVTGMLTFHENSFELLLRTYPRPIAALWLLKRPCIRDHVNSRIRNTRDSSPLHILLAGWVGHQDGRPLFPVAELVKVINGLTLYIPGKYAALHEVAWCRLDFPELIKCCLQDFAAINATKKTVMPIDWVGESDYLYLTVLEASVFEDDSMFVKCLVEVVEEMTGNARKILKIREAFDLALYQGAFHSIEVLVDFMPALDFPFCLKYMSSRSSATHYTRNMLNISRQVMHDIWKQWICNLYTLAQLINYGFMRISNDACFMQQENKSIRFFTIAQKLNEDTLIRVCKLVYSHPKYDHPAISTKHIQKAIRHFSKKQ